MSGGRTSPQTKLIKIGEGEEGLVNVAVLPDGSEIRQPTADDKNTQASMGDLHGCVVSAVWQTYRLGSISIPADKHARLCTLYLDHHPLDEVVPALASSESEAKEESPKTSETESTSSSEEDEFTKIIKKYIDQQKEVEGIIESIEAKNKELTIEFRGDDTGDRGAEDAWTGLFIKRLIDLGLKIKIMFSNHGAEFLYAVYCLLRDETFELNDLINGLVFVPVELSDEKEYTMSLQNMGMLLMLKIIDRKWIIDFVENYYLPNLYLIDVLRDTRKNEAVTYITHAPTIPKTEEDLHLKALADFFGVTCDVANTKSHPKVADEINMKFREWWKTTSREKLKEILQDSKHIIHKTIWNREVSLPPPSSKPRQFGFGHQAMPSKIEKRDKGRSLVGIDHPVAKANLDPGVLRQSMTTFSSTPKKGHEPKEEVRTPIPEKIKSRRARRVDQTLFVPAQPVFDENEPQPSQPSGASQPSKSDTKPKGKK